MPRPGLYDELVRFNVLGQGRVIALGDGSDASKASRLESVLQKAGSEFKVSPRAVFILRRRLQEIGDQPGEPVVATGSGGGSTHQGNKPKSDQSGKRRKRKHKKPLHPHDGRRDNRPPPGPHSTAFKPGNDVPTRTGEFRNPFLHVVPPEDAERVLQQGTKSEEELLLDSIIFYDARLLDMTRRLARLQAEKKQLLTMETHYRRQEGDGELMGTGRIAERKRKRIDDRIIEIHEAITRTQNKRDAAVAKLAEIRAKAQGNRKQGLADVLADLFPAPEAVGTP